MNAALPTLPPLFAHQEYTADFVHNNPLTFITSDPGTGKTRSVLEGFARRKAEGSVDKMLVVAPLSILQPAWGNDIERWTPHLSYGTSVSGSNRKRLEAFEDEVDIVIINHDAVKWLITNSHLLQGFQMIAVDESTAFKRHTSGRSKAIRALVEQFPIRVLMTGTPTSNGICDIWHQAYLLDSGERLGRMYHGFRMQVCTPVQVGPNVNMVKWIDKLGAEEIVAERLRDITVRFRFEDCLDVPEHTFQTINVQLPPKLMAQYQQLETETLLWGESGKINAVHAGVKAQKLLQLCSGAVYDENRSVQLFDTSRYEVVMQLVAERDHSVVAFNWTHQRDQLVALATKQKISFGIIDGTVSQDKRSEVIADFQAGHIQTLFLHPQSAGHGITLTRGRATIWASPTYNAEWFQQLNARIYRAGQERRTETIMVAAENTKEIEVYEILHGKRGRMTGMLDIFSTLTGETYATPVA